MNDPCLLAADFCNPILDLNLDGSILAEVWDKVEGAYALIIITVLSWYLLCCTMAETCVGMNNSFLLLYVCAKLSGIRVNNVSPDSDSDIWMSCIPYAL